MPEWYIVLAGSVSLLTGLGLAWRALRALSKAVSVIECITPVLIEIGQQFKPDSGSSLHDQITDLKARAESNRQAAAKAVQQQGELATMNAAEHKILTETQQLLIKRLDGLQSQLEQVLARLIDAPRGDRPNSA